MCAVDFQNLFQDIGPGPAGSFRQKRSIGGIAEPAAEIAAGRTHEDRWRSCKLPFSLNRMKNLSNTHVLRQSFRLNASLPTGRRPSNDARASLASSLVLAFGESDSSQEPFEFSWKLQSYEDIIGSAILSLTDI